jgi:hypothetical protein
MVNKGWIFQLEFVFKVILTIQLSPYKQQVKIFFP